MSISRGSLYLSTYRGKPAQWGEEAPPHHEPVLAARVHGQEHGLAGAVERNLNLRGGVVEGIVD